MLVCGTVALTCLPNSRICTLGGLPDESQSTPNQPLQPSQEKIASGDSSRPLYAMYSRISQEEDNRIAELHQRSADGILIFVSPRVTQLFSG